jgi:hypothetical protein
MIARWWGGGRLTAVTRALRRMPTELAEVDVEGARGFVRRDDLSVLEATEPGEHVRLLPGFDPFTNELPRHVDSVLHDRLHDRVHRTAGWVSPVVVVDGRVGGTWQIGAGPKGTREIRVEPFDRWRRGARTDLKAEADRLAGYLERRVALAIAR